VPGAAYGPTQGVAQSIIAKQNLEGRDTGGIGGTLAGNALSLAAMRATLEKVLTPEAFTRMILMAERWTEGVSTAIADFGLPWHVTRLGCRAEYLFSPVAPRNGTQAHDAMDFELERFMGSERESVRTRILRGFLQSDELGLGGRQALRLQEQVVHVAISSATPEQRFDVAVHRFDHSHRHLGPAIVEDALQVIQ
jgi:hypothetical protein